MNVHALFDAVGEIDDRFLAEAESLRPTRRGKPRLRVVLIAAALACLFSVTAYAAGWFGLGARVTPSRDLSLSGILDSEEARAYTDWTAYRDTYVDAFLASQGDAPFDMAWTSESPELNGAAVLYGAPDRSSAVRLLDIAAQHGLTLHTRALRFTSGANFLRAAGIPRFAGEETEYRGLVYEDGSYTAELTIPLGDGDTILTLERHFTGKMQPTGLERTLVQPENFLEWSYQNAHGQVLSLALSSVDEQLFALGNERVPRDGNRLFPFYVFYWQNGQYLTAAGHLRLSADHGFDEAAARAQLESIADAIDFEAAAAADCDTTFFLDFTPVSAPADGKPDLAVFLTLPEAQATLMLQRELAEDMGMEIGRGMEFAVHGGGDLDVLRNGDPLSGSKIDSLLEAAAAQYHLRYPSQCRSFRGSGLSENEILAAAGQGDFGGEIRYLLDNGVFWGFDTDRNEFLYLPHGGFLAGSLLYALPEAAEGEGWFYKNQNGDTVWLCRSAGESRVGYLLYESEGGWFLLLVNSPELWQLEEVADQLRLSELS